MSTRLLAAALVPAWLACTYGWAAWVAVHYATGGVAHATRSGCRRGRST